MVVQDEEHTSTQQGQAEGTAVPAEEGHTLKQAGEAMPAVEGLLEAGGALVAKSRSVHRVHVVA